MAYGNGLNDWNTYTQDYELDVLGCYDGATSLINRANTRTDNLNLTNVWDNVTAANNQTYWYTAANRLQNANGPWGSKTFYYDGVGNRTSEISTPSGGSTTTDVLGYPATSNRVVQITRGAADDGACPCECRDLRQASACRHAGWRSMGSRICIDQPHRDGR